MAAPDIVLIGINPSDPAIADMRDGLIRRGFAVAIATDGAAGHPGVRALVLIGFPARFRQTIRMIEAAGARRPRVIVWQYEPLPPPDLPHWACRLGARTSAVQSGRRWAKPLFRTLSAPVDLALTRLTAEPVSGRMLRFLLDNFAVIRTGTLFGWLDVICVSTEQKRAYLAAMGLPAEFLPVGQQPSFGRDLGQARDIDVLFIGSLKSRRRRAALQGFENNARACGLRVVTTTGPVQGEERTRLVNRARVVLHLHQMSWDTPWMRWCLASANGAVVASEPLCHPEPLRPGTDYLSASLAHLDRAIADLVADAGRLDAMRLACRDTLARHMTLDISLDRLAALVHGLEGPRA